ncbi:hypothetical protein [Anaeromyxobacter paludicola]|uniref:DsrE family protein n=1 Tax=Anaeromyxobacter paludicola TaxID=2918171 RepID=A0ABM7X7J9_9BACT|nr:hypothetical protein [Anaeromyxobacter paludicola]BDG07817.1 hypothetical protein AMPC_09300 [Anaeromyxobacter paludicola]
MASPALFLLRSTGWEARYQAATLAATAAALGDDVRLALFFDALRAWALDRFDEGAPHEAAAAGVPSIRETLDEARAHLGLRVVACDTAVRLAGLSGDAAALGLDAIESLPALWRFGRGGAVVSI